MRAIETVGARHARDPETKWQVKKKYAPRSLL